MLNNLLYRIWDDEMLGNLFCLFQPLPGNPNFSQISTNSFPTRKNLCLSRILVFTSIFFSSDLSFPKTQRPKQTNVTKHLKNIKFSFFLKKH